MRRALALAARGRGRTDPNPMVGAVVLAGRRIVGEGFHRRAGLSHAEVEALEEAGAKARGATLVVTLEPCAHTGRTPPCIEAIVSAGIRRVVVAARDPNPVARGGAALLRGRGIQVEEGLLEQDAWRLNDAYHVYHERGRPLVALKTAATLDGRIAAPGGASRWITSLRSRVEAHRLRARHDAVLVGVGTVLADDPLLTVRHVRGAQPLRVVLDSKLRTPETAQVLSADAPTLLAVTEAAPEERVAAWRRAGRQLVVVPADADGHVDLAALLWTLARREVRSVLVEGGRAVYTACLRSGVVDRLHCFLAPRLLGGRAVPWTGDLAIESVEESIVLSGVRVRRLSNDLLVEGYLAATEGRTEAVRPEGAVCSRG